VASDFENSWRTAVLAELLQVPPLVRVTNAEVTFGRTRRLQAVAGVSLEIAPGEVLAVVGESGSGKSTLARAIVGLQRTTGGAVEFPTRADGTRGRTAQMIFQDPRASLNPRMTVRQILLEAAACNTAKSSNDRLIELLAEVGLGPETLARRPEELSGGQCQRISIARSLMTDPDLLVCDEVVSALDVSIQAQVLELLRTLKQRESLAMLFITHDLGVVRQLADRVAVMYLGKIVEIGAVEDIFTRPTHPYTQALLSSAMDMADGLERRAQLELRGALPSPSNPPSGCRLHPRCWKAREICGTEEPPLGPVGDLLSACHFAEPLDVLNGER
jgi:oligopeptide transport system ATP-binding protein